MRFHEHVIVLIASKIITIAIPPVHKILGTTPSPILAVPLRRLLHVIRIHLVVLDLISKNGNVPHIAVHALHQALVLVHESPDGVPRISGSGQMAEGLLTQVTGNRRQHLGPTTSRHLAIGTARIGRIEAKTRGD